MSRVVFVTNIPAPYREALHEKIHKELGGDYHVIYADTKEPNRSWTFALGQYQRTFLKPRFITYRDRYIHANLDVLAHLDRLDPEIVITTGFNPTFLLAFMWCRRNGRKHIPFTDAWLRSEAVLTTAHRLVRRLVFHGSSAFIGTSHHSLDLYRAYGIPERKLFRSYLCVDNGLFFSPPFDQRTYDLLFSGRISEGKMPDFFARVAADVSRFRSGTKVLVLGDGPERGRLMNALKRQNVDAHFAGFVAQKDLPHHYASARLLLFPTRQEAWGVVTNEACASGVPVITCSNAGAADDLIVDGENGFVLPLDDQLWSQRSRNVLDSPDMWGTLSGAARRRVLAYNFENAAGGVLAAIEHCRTHQRKKRRRRRVVIVQRRLTHYRAPLFDSLKSLLQNEDIELELLVGEPTKRERAKRDEGQLGWAQQLRTKYVLDGRVCWQPFGRYLDGADLVIVPPEDKLVYNHTLLFWPRKFKLAFWGHGPDFRSARSFVRRGFKHWATRRPDWWFAYTSRSVDEITRAGFPPGRITVLDNAVDTESMRRLNTEIAPSERSALRTKLQLRGFHVCAFLGSLYPDKRLTFLFEAACEVRSRINDFELLIIGDGPDAHHVQAWCAKHSWIRWVGSQTGRDKMLHLSLADLLLVPSAVGLSILDSFVSQTPLVTTGFHNHGPEIAYLRDGVNGVITEPSVKAYAETIIRLLRQPEVRASLREQCARDAKLYSLALMAERFRDGIRRVLDE